MILSHFFLFLGVFFCYYGGFFLLILVLILSGLHFILFLIFPPFSYSYISLRDKPPTQLKKYLDYENELDFELFVKLLDHPNFEENKLLLRKEINNIHSSFNDYRQASLNKFFDSLNKAIIEDRKARIKDYIIFIYSRLLNFHTLATISLKYLFLQKNLY